MNFLFGGFCTNQNVVTHKGNMDVEKQQIDYFTLETLKHMNKNLDYLDKISYENTKPFVPPITSGKVVKVYDGDTITIASKLPNTEDPIYRFSIRLSGIDSPEIKGKTIKEKELAKKSRDSLANLIEGKIVTLKNISTEKYGRILADVFLDDLHVNVWMLQHNYAIKYDGGKKNSDSWV
jgi:endonuclease YncB( thermonuclease family)